MKTQPAAKPSRGRVIGLVGWGCLVLAVFVALIALAAAFGLAQQLRRSDPYRESLAAVALNPAAAKALGEPIEPGLFVTGSIRIQGDDGRADIEIPVRGPDGSGVIHIEGARNDGEWTYEIWRLEVEGRADPIPLAR